MKYVCSKQWTDQTLHICFSIGPDIQMKYSNKWNIVRYKERGTKDAQWYNFLFCLIMGGIGVDVSRQLQTNKNYFRP